MTWPIAVATGGYVEEPAARVLAAAHEAGFTEVEIGTPPRHFSPWDRAHVAAVRDVLEWTGITPVSMHAPFGGLLDLAEFNPRHRQAAVAAILTAAGALAHLGGRIVVVHPSDIPRRADESARRTACCVEALRELAAALEGMHMQLAVETPLPHLFGGHPDEFTGILRELPRGTGVCLDTGHTHLGTHWHRFIELVGERVVHVHATDTHGQFDDHLPPGDGVIDWAEIQRTLRACGFTGTIVLEIGAAPGPMAPYFRRALAQARTIFSPGS